ncbi:hypothetical protein QQ045_022456 [Rhodiola kirilowii]
MEAAPANERRRIRRERNKAQNQIPAFGNWDSDHDQVPITHYFESYPRPPPPPPPPSLHSSITRASVYPYAANYPRFYSNTGYVEVEDELHNSLFAARDEFHLHGVYDGRPPQYSPNTLQTILGEVKGQCGTRRRGRRRSCLDNSRKVFDVTEATPTESYSGPNDAVRDTDLYGVASVQNIYQDESKKSKAKDEDLYKIPPELLRNSKRKKVRKFFAKCFVTICASY